MEAVHKTILIIDESSISGILGALLVSHGYKVEIAVNGIQALERARSRVDLILLDMAIQDCEGKDICQQLKEDPQTKEIPIIIISGKGNKSERIEGLYLGADDYLTKPFSPQELFHRMEAVLKHPRTETQDDLVHHQETLCELKRIVEEESIDVHFQPIYFLRPMRLLGLEMLSRPRSTTSMVNPEVFFKMALKYGFYYEVEMIGWQKALKIASEAFDGRQKLFLNCDPYLVESERFMAVREIFSGFGISSREIFLEITERSAVVSFDVFYERLREYRYDGFQIAVDDLGAGYSSLEAIVELRPNAIKLDKHIIIGVGDDPYKRSIVKLFVAFCRENNVICVAEGIETKKDFEALLELGVDAGQGYYLYRPTGTLDLPAMHALER